MEVGAGGGVGGRREFLDFNVLPTARERERGVCGGGGGWRRSTEIDFYNKSKLLCPSPRHSPRSFFSVHFKPNTEWRERGKHLQRRVPGKSIPYLVILDEHLESAPRSGTCSLVRREQCVKEPSAGIISQHSLASSHVIYIITANAGDQDVREERDGCTCKSKASLFHKGLFFRE